MTDILGTINHYWPNTVVRYAPTAESFPEGIVATSCCGGFVEIREGAVLPSNALIEAQFANYDAYIATQLSNAIIKQQILELEATQTPRRIREALSDPLWLNNLNAQIDALRAQLNG